MATARKARWTAGTMVLAAWLGAAGAGEAVAPVRAEDAPPPAMGDPAPTATGRTSPTAPVAESPVPGMLDVMIGDGLTTGDLLRAVSLVTKRQIVWSDQDRSVMRQLKATTRLRVPTHELFDVARDLVATQEVVLVPVGPAASPIWYAVDARTTANLFVLRTYATPIVFTDDVARDLQHRTGLFVSAVVPAPVSNLREARAALGRLVSPNNVGSVTELPDAGAFLVTDFAPQAVAVYRALQAMRPRGGPPGPDDALIDVYAFASVEERDAGLATLRELFVERVAAPAPQAPSPKGPRFSVPGAQLRVLVRGTTSELAVVRVAAEACGGRLDPGASSPR
jgi:hypothetical protein